MKKRIISLVLAILVLAAAFPVTIGAASDEIEYLITDAGFPKYTASYKAANNFPDEKDTFRSLTKEYGIEWDNGVTAAPGEYVQLDSANAPATLTVEPGKATVTGVEPGEGSASNVNVMILFKSVTEADTNYIAIHVDASALSETEYCELSIKNQAQQLYAAAGSTYYFLPDATDENPNPEAQTRTTTGTLGQSVWQNRFWIEKGDVGTLYIPETLFAEGNANIGNEYGDTSESGIWNGDFSLLLADAWRVANNNRLHSSIRFNFKGGLAAGDSIVFSNMQWVSVNDFALGYDYKYIAEDFSDADSVSFSYWGNGYTLTDDNFSVSDGAFKHTVTADTWENEESVMRYGYTVSLDRPATDRFEALMYDVDFSTFTNIPALQITYNTKNTDVSRTAYVRRFIVANSTVYAVWENGVVDEVTVSGNDEWQWVNLPVGFKGTVVIPFDAFKNLTVGNYTYDGKTTDLYKTDDINDYSVTIDTRNIAFADKGEVITYDNFGYLTANEPVIIAPNADYTYSVYHNDQIVRDYETFVKETQYISTWADNEKCDVSIDNFSSENGMLKFSVPEQFKVETEATDDSEAQYYTKEDIGITVSQLPNVVNAEQTAVSVYVDRSAATRDTYLRISFDDAHDDVEAYQPGHDSVLYLIGVDGTVTEQINTNPWSSVTVPAGFKGNVVIPFTSFKTDWGWGEFITAETVLKDTQSNNARLIIYLLEATPGDEYFFNNISYVEEYNADDLSSLRQALLNDTASGADINGDGTVDILDIIRLKKVMADAYIIR